ncbi:MAG: M1 family metallopeptidase [Anaerolineae bacterium]|nr:M1 family metallopeptidase [Anaerolineae bacterium]MDW8070398.1 M1 family metallopeptidase [Anaerolineae bacterium]
MTRPFAYAVWALVVLSLVAGEAALVPGLAHESVASHWISSFAAPIRGVETRSIPAPYPTPSPRTPFADLVMYQPALLPRFAADLAIRANAPRYDITLSLEEGEKPVLRGVQHVHYTNEETVPLAHLVFRLYPNLPAFGGAMEVGTVRVNAMPAEPVYAANRSAIYVPLRPALMPGQKVDVTMEFHATLPTDTHSGYAVFTYADEVYALAGFYPTIPVYDSHGWNVEIASPYGDVTFTDTAFYRVQLHVPSGLTVVSSGQTVEVTDRGDGTRSWTVVAGPMRDFYVAMSRDYQRVYDFVDGVRVNSYYRSGQEKGGEQALHYGRTALHLFSRLFGPYPYTELDIVPTPTNAGGIEYPGVIVTAQSLYPAKSEYLELVVAHEVAHQWWYGLVGSDQLDEPWMDEALTNYCAYIYFQHTASAERAQYIKKVAFENAYQELQRNHLDRAIGGPVAGFCSQSDYVAVVYGKGPLFFDAVRERLGDTAFFAGLRLYLERHRYRIAYPEDLITALEEASGQSIDDLYNTWVRGEDSQRDCAGER